ncbi:MAG: hypothetical protein V3W34_15660 [Phycisphaerae bacterium]
MQKPKRGKALLELIHQQDASYLRTPGWWRSPDASAGQPEAAPASHSTRASAAVEPLLSDVAPRRLVSLHGKHVVFSLSSTSAAAAVFVLMLLVGLSFLVGRRTGVQRGLADGFRRGADSVRASAVGEIEAARNAAPNRDIFVGLGSSPLKAAATGDKPTDSVEAASGTDYSARRSARAEGRGSAWVTGHTYIVVQEFKAGDQVDAAAARLFLRDHGIETDILESRGTYKYRLLTLKGFNREDPDQRKWCDQYHAKIKELGRLFVKAGGRYDLQGYQKTLTGAGW